MAVVRTGDEVEIVASSSDAKVTDEFLQSQVVETDGETEIGASRSDATLANGKHKDAGVPLWERYHDFEQVAGYGEKDPSESWGTWRKQIDVARAFLTSPEMKDRPVQFIVETQLLLRPYLIGRRRMHLLYKIFRADNPDALYSDFLAMAESDIRSFSERQDEACSEMRSYLSKTNDVNEASEGATRLWKAAEKGFELAVHEILQHPDIDPNKPHGHTQTTPLYIAAHHGHVEVVMALLAHPKVQVNLGKVDTKASPLVAAAQEGREKVVVALLGASGIDINQATTEGMSPLCAACELVHEHIVDHLLAAGGINTEHMLKNGATALSIAASRGNVKIIESVVFDLQRNVGIKLSMDMFPVRDQFESSVAYREAVVAWAVVNCETSQAVI